MKVVCDRGALLEGVNLVSGIVAARTPRPQLTCVKLVAKKDGKAGELTLAATDAEISLVLTLGQVDVAEPGEALVPADKLRQIVSAEDNEPTLTLETDGETLHIRGTDAHFKILGYPADDFPPMPDFQETLTGGGSRPAAKATFTHPAGGMSALISRTLFATARENSRYAINGVLLKRAGKSLEMVATDGKRLALCKAKLAGSDKDAAGVSCIIPSKALNTLQKLMSDAEEPVRVAVTDTQVLFSLGAEDGEPRAVLSSNLVEGVFPPYEEVLPKDQDKRVTFDRDLVFSAVRRAALLTNEESRGVRMSFDAGKKHLKLSSRAPEMGEASIDVDLNGYEGEDLEIGFNPSFLLEALRVVEEPQVVMELKAGNKPGLIKSGSDFLYVVMPVNLQ
ncbi:MAG: DNA polymerase III subunit beta [Phycisphaerales bacterium]|jgi:DNA polymerase-3 subunit beta|nr:DNA polymerase III subunit beta [Phycisphaerales bacterium]